MLMSLLTWINGALPTQGGFADETVAPEDLREMARTKKDPWGINLEPIVELLGLGEVIEKLGPYRVIEQLGARRIIKEMGFDRLMAELTPAERDAVVQRFQKK